jgi:hypothetical protein
MLSAYGVPLKEDCTAVLRIYLYGTGISVAKATEMFGVPRFEKTLNNFRHLIYGNVDLIYNENGKYVAILIVKKTTLIKCKGAKSVITNLLISVFKSYCSDFN